MFTALLPNYKCQRLLLRTKAKRGCVQHNLVKDQLKVYSHILKNPDGTSPAKNLVTQIYEPAPGTEPTSQQLLGIRSNPLRHQTRLRTFVLVAGAFHVKSITN